MAETEETLKGNWYKAAMGLRYAKEGLQQFVTDEMDTFHKKVLQKLPPRYHCNTCTIQNVLQCPTLGTCGGKPCNFHDNTDPIKQYSPCPRNICGVIRDEVKHVHRYRRPTFKNSDAQVWFNNSWELAKCFMPQGYSDSTAADDTDFSGLINVILCHVDFQAIITENLNQAGNKFEKARETRNSIMHSPKMELSTIDMNRHFQLLTDVLSDKQHLQTLSKAQESKKKLKELQQGSIIITASDKEMIHKEYLEQLKNITDEGVKHIEKSTTESIENIERKTKDNTEKFRKEMEIGVEHFKETVEESRGSLKRTAADAETAIHEQTERAKKIIEDTKDVLVEDMKEKVEVQIDSHTQSSLNRIEDEKNRGIKALQVERAKAPDQIVEDYDEKKKNLQKELIDHYFQNDYCKSAIPALIDNEEVDVADIFDMPKMRIKQSSSKDSGSQKDEYRNMRIKQSSSKDLGSQKAEHRDIKTIFEIFQTERERILRACISGEAGYGKTTLCQKILSNWCKLHTNQQIKSLQSDDRKFLKSFDFLFYIPLRNHTTPDIVEMIKAELVRRDMHDILDQVLRRDSCKCFIILDGLDEWLLHEDCGKRIPVFDQREKVTVLITSRPWKLEVLRPKNREIGHEVELRGVTDVNKCVKAVVDYLNKIRGGKKTLGNIFKEEQFIHVRHLMQVPTLLTEIVCMWYDDMDFGKTRVDVYCRMIEYYLQIANKRQKDTTKHNSYEFSGFESRKTENDCLLDIFRDLPFCKKYSDLLSRLSDLAFHTLFSEKKDGSLVFPHSLTEIYRLNEVDLTYCLKAGLLSQARFFCKVTLQTKKLSFIHKTIQEFLAAVYIVNNDNTFKDMLKKLSCLKDVFEMEEFLRFLGGLRPDLIYDISKHIAVLTDKDEAVISYRKSIDGCLTTYLLERVQHLIYDLVEEGCRCNKGEMVNKVIIRDIHFSRRVKGKEKIYEHIKEDEIKSFVMKYDYSYRHKEINMLTQLRSLRIKFHKANICKVSFIIETQADFDYLMDMLQNNMTPLTSLRIMERRQYDIRVDYQSFFRILIDKTCLTGISLENIKLDHSGIEQIAQFLSSRAQFEEIMLRCISCVTCRPIRAPCKYRIDLAPCRYIIDLSNHQKLRRLDIRRLSGQVTLCDGLPLQYCRVETCECGPSVIACLTSSDSLQTLVVYGLFSDHQIHRYTTREDGDSEASPSSSGLSTILITVIPTLRNLKILELSRIDFGQNLLRLSSDMKYLRSVKLFSCTQTEESFKCFIDSFPETQGVLRVSLFVDSIVQNNSDISRTAENYLSQKYHKSHRRLERPFIITFSNDNHIITLLSH